MFENHFYNESTRRMVSVFGSIFNDMEVVKKDAAGKEFQRLGWFQATVLADCYAKNLLAFLLPKVVFEKRVQPRAENRCLKTFAPAPDPKAILRNASRNPGLF